MSNEQNIFDNNCCYTLCPNENCNRVPFIKLVESTYPNIVKIECDCQKEENSNDNNQKEPIFMTIEEYLKTQLNKRDTEQKGTCENCEEEKEKMGEYYNVMENEWWCENCKKKTENKEEKKKKKNKSIFLSRKCEIHCKCENEDHEDNLNELYCEDCKKYLCNKCKKVHQEDHKNIFDIVNVNKNFKFREYLKKLQDENSNIRNKELKDQMIENLQKQIELIKKAFEENEKTNENIKQLIKNILYTFLDVSGNRETFKDETKSMREITNYHVIANIEYNCNFNVPYEHFKFNPKDTSLMNINKLISYYKTNFIFGNNDISLKDCYKVKHIVQENDNQSQITGITTLLNGNIICFSDEGLYGLGNDDVYEKKLYTINEGNNDFKYTSAVWELDNNYLVTGKTNNVITIWKVSYNDNKINLEKIHEYQPKDKGEIKGFISISNKEFAGFSESQIIIFSYEKEEDGNLKTDSIKTQLITSEDTGNILLTALIKPKNLDNVIMCGSSDECIFIWDIENQERKDFENNDNISCICQSAFIEVDNNIICVASENKVYLLDYTNWKKKKEIKIIRTIEYQKTICHIVPTRLNNVLLLGCLKKDPENSEKSKIFICSLDLKKEEKSLEDEKELTNNLELLVSWGRRSFLLSEGEGNISFWNY